jgi:K+-sensing histidine kinase KdpD
MVAAPLGSLALQAAQVAEADRERTALLAAVSHDLRAARRGQGRGQRPARR